MYKVMLFVILFVTVSLTWGEDYYENFGISRSAGRYEVCKVLKKLAITHYSDKKRDDSSANDKFDRLMRDYRELENYDLRKKYDLYEKDDLNDLALLNTYYFWCHSQKRFMYYDDEHVVILETSENYKDVINSDSIWFVNFCSPLDYACQELASTWKKVAKLLDGSVKIAAVDCEHSKILCQQKGTFHSYPTLLYFQKYSQHGTLYKGEHTQEAIIRFALDGLNIHVPEISESEWVLFLRDQNILQRPMLIFISSDENNCYSSEQRFIITAIFEKLIDVRVFKFKNGNHDKISYDIRAVYLPKHDPPSRDMHLLPPRIFKPIFFDCIFDINNLIEKLLDQLPSPQELSDNDFKLIRNTKSDVVWLVCFYTNYTWGLANLRHFNLQMKKASASGVNLGKMNCDRNRQLCSKLGVNRYPIWGLIKPGGAFELDYRENINNDINKFVEISVKATNVWSLSADETLSILQRNNGEVWFLVWFTPWYPPCLQFLSEIRRASLNFDASIIRFGTIDCTVHITLCRRYNTRSYHTAMLIKGGRKYQFTLPERTRYIIQFINEKITHKGITKESPVLTLTSKTFYNKLRENKNKVMWIVDYFVPECELCQRLELEWKAVAKSLNILSFVNVASVNCEAEVSLCISERVPSYPHIKIYLLENGILKNLAFYKGPQDWFSILTWITTHFPKKIHDLNLSDFQQLLKSEDIWVVAFYLPHLWNYRKIEPEFAIAAQLLKGVKFGKINCVYSVVECEHIKQFPTIILYRSKQKIQNRYDGVKIIASTAKSIRDDISLIIRQEMINSRTKHDEL